MRYTRILTIGLMTILAGCDLAVTKNAATPPPTGTPGAPSAPVPTLPTSGGILAPGSLEEMGAPVSGTSGGAPALNPPANVPGATPGTTQEVAGVGSGIKGRSLEQPGTNRMIAEPALAYFRTKDKLVFQVQIPQALNLYKASEGKAPASHDEFMQVIIQANQINLPALPPGQRYIYDPTTEQLMVERPSN